MNTLDERIRKLEAQAAYQERRTRRIVDVIKSAAGHLSSLTDAANVDRVIYALKSAAGQLGRVEKDNDKPR
jgi:uncharacterized coiled-coil protein SlyX